MTPEGTGEALIVQLVPFHARARVTVAFELFTAKPTAVHADDDAQETPSNSLLVAPLGFGVDWIAQPLPFQRSASVTVVPPLFLDSPTAVQAVAEVHDTP